MLYLQTNAFWPEFNIKKVNKGGGGGAARPFSTISQRFSSRWESVGARFTQKDCQRLQAEDR